MDKITVTKAFLPPIEEYTAQMQRAWDNQWLTNRGELVLELEQKLMDYLEISNIILTNNGTVPLQIALKLLGKGGEIITTPFSYVATTSSIVWEGCTPIYVDIDPVCLTIDPAKIEAAITDKTTAILATHVFGNPCDVEAIADIAERYNLKVIYDAAHCFGVTYKGRSIFEFGDISSCSFHATKLFHTAEGGALFSGDKELQHQMFYSHNFGHDGPSAFFGVGINGKMSEVQAGVGLSVLPYMQTILNERKAITDRYDQAFAGTDIQTINIREGSTWNYAYYPVVLKSEEVLLKYLEVMNAKNIFPRRYFYPSLNTIHYTGRSPMPISEDIASRVLCLPLYVGLPEDSLQLIIDDLLELHLP